jgi:murein DD-endopeptidase MepM/ murein hydrolase activator NlpD
MRGGAIWAVCRVLLAAVLALAALTWAQPVAAAPGDSLASLEQQLIDAKNEANAAAARFTEAQSRYEQLGDDVAMIEQKIKVGEERAAGLQEVAQRRAVIAYKTQGADISVLFETDDPRDGARSFVLLDAANASDKQAVADYVEAAADLAAQREQLTSQRKLQREALDKFAGERKVLDAKVADAQKAQRNFDAKGQAAVDAAPNSGVTTVSAPVVDGQVCPVPGAGFSDDFGQPRTGHRHQGNDMFAPTGTSNLAVVAGDVTFGDGGAGGMGAYLAGDNGVTYIYYHLSQYVGGPRRVSQGEIIGKVGTSGNAPASAPHTHFEMRPDGRTAAPINPYPTISKIC